MEYSLNPHSQELLDQFRQNLPVYKKMEQVVVQTIQQIISEQGIPLSGIEHRVKAEKSLAGKLELKGGKYASISDITDLFGMRIITFYTDDVDKVAAIVKRTFSVDWNESVDKRKLHDLTSFGYNSLHYICRIPETLACDPNMPQLNEFRFEIPFEILVFDLRFFRNEIRFEIFPGNLELKFEMRFLWNCLSEIKVRLK